VTVLLFEALAVNVLSPL
jgi:hypothetical protein